MTPLWIEVHVDAAALDRALPWRARGKWAAIAGALDDLARRAERHGARLSFRVRERFAERDRDVFLARLVARGHEVGWHAHGKRLREARDAVVAAGGDAEIATPGLVQAGVRGWRALATEARDLGARVMTDRVEAPLVAYQGWLAWEPVPGLVAMDVSVSPFSWGVLRRQGRRVVPGRLEVERLMMLIAGRDRLRPPSGAVSFFGATLHDHDVLEEGARDAMERVFARYGRRVVPSAEVLGRGGAPPATPPPGSMEGVAQGGPSRGSGSEGRGGRRSIRGDELFARLRRLRLRVERRGAPHVERILRVDGREVPARRVGPAAPEAVVVLVHGGGSGVAQGLTPFGASEAALAERGLAAWSFARTEGAAPPGSAETVAETVAVLREALAEGRPVVLLTWSAGVVPGLRAALEVDDPRVVALVDVEGPADRFSLVPPGEADHPLAALDEWDEAAWAGREAAELIGGFPGRYLRVQAARDHVHGEMAWHAHRMVEAARHGRLNAGDGALLPGRVDAHGDTILGWVREIAAPPR